MKLWQHRRALGAILLLLGAGSLQGCAYPNYGYAGYPAYGGYGYPAYGGYGYPGYAELWRRCRHRRRLEWRILPWRRLGPGRLR